MPMRKPLRGGLYSLEAFFALYKTVLLNNWKEGRIAMKKLNMSLVLVFVLLIAFASFAIAQMAGKPWEKTVTLPSGEVILDMNGEWNTQSEFFGPLSYMTWNPIPDILTIMQFGNEISSIDEKGFWSSEGKGAEIFKGKLDKDGFKAIYIYTLERHMVHDADWVECKWEISENGNKVMLGCGEGVKLTLNRR